jgi:DNA ligase-4
MRILYRYFFHACAERQETEDYKLDDEDALEDVDILDKTVEDIPEDSNSAQTQAEESAEALDKVDPLMADWFKVDDKTSATKPEDSETEPDEDSDNADVKADEDDGGDDADNDVGDDWLKVNPGGSVEESEAHVDMVRHIMECCSLN